MNELIKKLQANIRENLNGANYYELIVTQFDSYIHVLTHGISDDNFNQFLQNVKELNGKQTKIRFINLIKKIQDQCLAILRSCYKGDFFYAEEQLVKLLSIPKFTDNKLKDAYYGYFVLDFERLNPKFYYRRVDFPIGKTDVNCWHVPFNLRHLASKGRFNMLGYPCFYLSDSPQGANAEVGNLKPGMSSHIGKFEGIKRILLLNFTLPDVKSMNDFDKFCFLVTYPFYLLCLVKAAHKESVFCEEYLFPQLFFHILFCHHKNGKGIGFPNFNGISYNSMEAENATNIVIPAKYSGDIPPLNGYSTYIKSMFKCVETKKDNSFKDTPPKKFTYTTLKMIIFL